MTTREALWNDKALWFVSAVGTGIFLSLAGWPFYLLCFVPVMVFAVTTIICARGLLRIGLIAIVVAPIVSGLSGPGQFWVNAFGFALTALMVGALYFWETVTSYCYILFWSFVDWVRWSPWPRVVAIMLLTLAAVGVCGTVCYLAIDLVVRLRP